MTQDRASLFFPKDTRKQMNTALHTARFGRDSVAPGHRHAGGRPGAGDADTSDHHVAARQWVDGLLAGTCTEGDFLTQILLLLDEDSDLAWEVLALLDQHHRRRELGDDLFKRVKKRLQQECLGYGSVTTVPERGSGAGSLSAVAQSRAAPALQPAPRPQPQPVMEPPRHRLNPGDVLKDRYRVVEARPRTKASLLIEAIDKARVDLPEVRQRVAITLLSDELSRDIDLVQRIYRLQSLSHPSIARIFDIDEDDGELFFTREWVTAVPLSSMLQREPALPGLPLARTILAAVASALLYAHERGVAHGNLDLHSVTVTESGEVCLQNFVLDADSIAPSTAGDLVAFAGLAHALLGRCAGTARPEGGDGAPGRPPGLTRSQWKLLRRTMLDHDALAGRRLLESFASPLSSTASGATSARRIRSVGKTLLWITGVAMVAGFAATVAYVLMQPGSSSGLASDRAATVTDTSR